MAARLVQKIYKDLVPRLEERVHEILGPPTINVGTILGGDQPSTVPGECTLRLDRRCVPGETIAQVYEELNQLVEELHEEDPRFQAQVKDMFDGTLTPHLPFYLEEDEPLIQAVKKVLDSTETEAGKEDWLTVMYAWTDAGILANYTSSKCIVFGPGELTTAHSSLECIQGIELLKGAYLYGEIAIEYCQVEEDKNDSGD
jgi:acetylornithine deacetylase/succinyl-diaminopimelate desuccinylase